MAKFTIFGARGWIGSNLVRRLSQGGHEVCELHRDNWPARGERLGHVVFAIGLTADFRDRPLATGQANVGVLAEALERYQFDLFLYLSTTRIYRNAAEAVEGASLRVNPTDPDHLYDITKLAGEALCLSLAQPTARVARLSNVIGPGDRSENFLSAVLADASRGAAVIRTSPDSEKDYVPLSYVLEIIEAIALGGRHRLYNVASGRNTSNRTIADLLHRHTGAELTFTPNAPRIAFPPIVVDRARTEFSATPMPFETAFAEFIDERARASAL